MAKNKTAFLCTDCGAEYVKWQGQCSACKEWNTIKEFKTSKHKPKNNIQTGFAGQKASLQALDQTQTQDLKRYLTQISEFDRVLGGGLVAGSVVLIGGDPGAGKSTILLQCICNLAQQNINVIYVTGEESPEQVGDRAKRLTLTTKNVNILSETCIDDILSIVDQYSPQVVVIDSIQTMYVDHIDATPGGVTQVKESAIRLTQYAKQNGVTFLMVGHVTKDKSIAGPMSLSHIIDTQISLSSTEDDKFRIMRTAKNRFGSTSEIGFFQMMQHGLIPISNPSAIFLNRSNKQRPGSVIEVAWEGTRPLLVEIQALTVEGQQGNPRRLSVGYDSARLAMILAVLMRHGHIDLHYNVDIFVNVVGGIKIQDTSADLPVLLSIISSFKDITLPRDMLAFGEIGLNGEIRPVANGQQRLEEAAKHGFKKAMIPFSNTPKIQKTDLEIYSVSDINDVLEVFSKFS
ncbi:MAG: DNA repair protein RadA [Pseudomonadota bacterium]